MPRHPTMLFDFTRELITPRFPHRVLTLTSFPFRIVFANVAFIRLRRNESVIGASLFDCFVSDDMETKPHLSQAKSFLGSLLNGVGSAIQIVAAENRATIPCVVNAYPVVSNETGAQDICYYAMRFNDIQT